jgi:hypothetical protein
MTFQGIWQRIELLAGEEFHTINGKPFNYEFSDGYLRPSRAVQNIPRSSFEKAYDRQPLRGPGEISRLVRGSSYVYAILTDSRVRE